MTLNVMFLDLPTSKNPNRENQEKNCPKPWKNGIKHLVMFEKSDYFTCSVVIYIR